MTDRIMLQNLRFEATHGYYDYEQRIPQPFEVDVELEVDVVVGKGGSVVVGAVLANPAIW